ncbi:MAG: hypothetical protein K0U39_06570 [Alphaproteobacteria bacterium]|nr:hypothetical protein [Alphaproteobacteria bacterium]
MMRMLAFYMTALTVFFYSLASWAHVKWFVDSENSHIENFQAYSLFDTPVLIWIFVFIIIIVIAVFLDIKLKVLSFIHTISKESYIELLRVFTGLSFLLTAYGGAIIAPHHIAHGWLGGVLIAMQALIGILLISNHLIAYAAAAIVVLVLGLMAQHGFVSGLEYINMIGIALFLLFYHFPVEETRNQLKPYCVDSLRIFTGIALVTLGVTEKLSGAMLGQDFLMNFQWNFMPFFGFDEFSDRLFVLSAGMSEVILGTLLIIGTVTRLTTLTISSLMLLSNIVFIIQGNNEEALVEFIGHMPIIGSALILILSGYGERCKITKWQLFKK